MRGRTGAQVVERAGSRARTGRWQPLAWCSFRVKALVCTVEVKEVSADAPDVLWNEVKHRAGISFEEFEKYYDGALTGFGIVCTNPRCLQQALTLDYVRHHWSTFSPPQVYRYLISDEVSFIFKRQPNRYASESCGLASYLSA
jgi:predicted transcriptional regulator